MPKAKQSKASVAQFEAVKEALVTRLKTFWDDETNPATFTPVNVDALGDLWDDVPELDSKAIQNASPIVEKFLGFKLTANFLKRGGYESFDDLVADLIPKLRAECAAGVRAKQAAPAQPQALQPRRRAR